MSNEETTEKPAQEQIAAIIEQEPDNVVHIDEVRIERLARHAQYYQLYDSFDLLRIKLLYNEPITPEEGIQLVTLTKYFMRFGHNEQLKIMAKHLHEKYMKKHGL